MAKNSIIFNGVSTDTLTGVIISELPSIDRAAERMNTVQVDGRDGDIAESLGWDTVDKEVTIGLTRGFDVDAINNYFRGSGTAIFSNEPTKIYRIRWQRGFSLERLVRFRRGKLRLVAQPFKKLVGETDVSGTDSVSVENKGYMSSQPIITIEAPAATEIVLELDGDEKMNIVMPDEGTITIDSETLNCFNSNADKNQYVEGSFIELTSGTHTIEATGGATSITVTPNSRWL
jgi:phage-related protein